MRQKLQACLARAVNMTATKKAEKITQVADTMVKTEAALGEMHHYYKFGRYLSAFPQKPYFLFSHCAHLLFSLWLSEQDHPVGIFTPDCSLTPLLDSLDFDSLRYLDYSRRMLYADAYEEHLKNEPQWCKFWIRLLQELQHSDAAVCEEFSRQFLSCLAHPEFLDGKLAKKDERSLADLVQSPGAGRLFLHSIWVLEDVISTGACHIGTLDPAAHGIEQMQSLVCLLGQLRRIVVWEAGARGPYILSADCGWTEPSALTRFLFGKAQGILSVTPREEGGELACTCTRNAGSPKARQRTWVRRVAALPHAYEEVLFKTWPLDDEKHSPDGRTPGAAQWIVDDLEAGHLETVCTHADKVLQGLGRHQACGRFAEEVSCVLRNGQSRWQPVELPWNYVKRLEQLTERLKFACREAKALGGENPAQKVITRLWPARTAAADTRPCAENEVAAADSAPAASPAVTASQSQRNAQDSQDRQKDKLPETVGLPVGEDPRPPKTGSEPKTDGDRDFYWKICKPPAAEPAPKADDVRPDSQTPVQVPHQGNR